MTAQAPNMASKRFLALLVLVAMLGVVASLAAWCFLELVHQANVGAYDKLPELFGFDSTPTVVVDAAPGRRGR